MKNGYFFLISLLVLSCSSEQIVRESQPEFVTIENMEERLSLEYFDVDVFFYNSIPGNPRFIGINNNQEVEIPVQLDLNLQLPQDSYGYYSYVDKVSKLNNRYDLISGYVKTFVQEQEVERNDTIYSIPGFSKQTSGDYFLFDKETFNFIELEEGFTINGVFQSPLQIIDNKFYYLYRVIGESLETKIKYLDLNDETLTPQVYHSDEYISSFLFNENMDLSYVTLPVNYRYRKYKNHQSNSIMIESDEIPVSLGNHFKGLDGAFYGQSIYGTIPPIPYGFYKVDVNSNSLTATELFLFDEDNSEVLDFGRSDFVVPNSNRNTNVIISEYSGLDITYAYEFNATQGTISPINLRVDSPHFVDYYNNNYFVIVDFEDSGETRIKKIDLDSYSMEINDELGYIDNGVFIDKNDGALYYLSTQNDISNFVKVRSNNTTERIPLSLVLSSCFSLIN